MAIEAQESAQAEQPAALVADENTMTIWGQTIGSILGDNRVAFEAQQNELQAEKAKVSDHQATIEGKDTEIAMLVEQLGKAKERAALLSIAPKSAPFVKYPDGSIALHVVLDVDSATPYLEQAEGAGEDPATYIPRQVAEALAAYSFS